MILISHELFNLLLTSLELHHYLPISLLHSLAVVALACTTVLKGFLPLLFCLLELVQLKLVEFAHGNCSIILFLASRVNSLLQLLHLLSPKVH